MRGSRRLRALDRLADEELLVLAASGDALAFERIYDRHSRAVYSLAHRILGTSPPAQDVAQEAFLAVWRTAADYEPARGSVRSWILSIAHHRAVDALRRAAVPGRAVARDPDTTEAPAPELTDRLVERREDTRTVRGALDGLPDYQRRVIELAYYGGFTQAEISEILRLPLGTVKGRTRSGLETLRGALAPAQTP